jgi:hypothetical protein
VPNKKITALHYPFETGKWNRIKHRVFAFISRNRQGIPLTNTTLGVSLIGAANPSTGRTFICVRDEPEYETDTKISDEDFGKMNYGRVSPAISDFL